MTGELEAVTLVGLIILARISSFLAVIPLVSAARVPQTIRAYLAIALAMTLAPILFDAVAPIVRTATGPDYLALLGGEILTGLFLGFLLRLFFLALLFIAEVISQIIGYTGMSVPGVIENELTAPLTNLVALLAAVLLFLNDIHHLFIEHIVWSYTHVPAGTMLTGEVSSIWLSETITGVFNTVVPLSAPFLIYAVVCNVLVGMANRLVPQVPIQLVTGPAILFGGLIVGLLVLAVGLDPIVEKFARSISVGE
jgi:flagellar biosynthetic protein FliR